MTKKIIFIFLSIVLNMFALNAQTYIDTQQTIITPGDFAIQNKGNIY